MLHTLVLWLVQYYSEFKLVFGATETIFTFLPLLNLIKQSVGTGMTHNIALDWIRPLDQLIWSRVVTTTGTANMAAPTCMFWDLTTYMYHEVNEYFWKGSVGWEGGGGFGYANIRVLLCMYLICGFCFQSLTKFTTNSVHCNWGFLANDIYTVLVTQSADGLFSAFKNHSTDKYLTRVTGWNSEPTRNVQRQLGSNRLPEANVECWNMP